MGKKKTASVSDQLTDLAILWLEDCKRDGWSEDARDEIIRLLTDACKASKLNFELSTLPVVWDHLLGRLHADAPRA